MQQIQTQHINYKLPPYFYKIIFYNSRKKEGKIMAYFRCGSIGGG